jgi:hypothetical protein
MNKEIFCIWSGDNEMSSNRQRCLQSIIDNSNAKVILITPNNLSDWIKSSDPIHPAYFNLSLTHRSDYLRAYLMHHYGGGYSDIKLMNFDWSEYFNQLDNSDKLFIGYQEQHPLHIATNNKIIRNSYKQLCGCGHFIMKPYSDFTYDWINTVNTILDNKLLLLESYPGSYHPRAVLGGVHGQSGIFLDSKYPLSWNEILGSIIHPLMYRYIGKFSTNMPQINLTDQYL